MKTIKHYVIPFLSGMAFCLYPLSSHAQGKSTTLLGKINESEGFTENKGQVHDQNLLPRPDILFGAKDGELNFHIRNSGLSYQLEKVLSYKDEEVSGARKNNKIATNNKLPDKIASYRIDVNWLGFNPKFKVTKGKAVTGHINYYMSHCPDGALDVKTYNNLTLNNLYNNIDLHYYIKDNHIKYDYIVKPGADYKQIQLEVKGAKISKNKNGGILFITPFGNIEDSAPLVFQDGKQLTAKWIIKENVLSFQVENANPEKELIIDPVLRLWGTYYGGTGYDYFYVGNTDATDNMYVCGYTASSTGTTIATSGSYQNTYGGGIYDAFLVKFSPAGVRMWGTYFGGSGTDYASGCPLDPTSSYIYLSGRTNTNNSALFTTPGAYQTNFGGGSFDAYIEKLDVVTGVRIWGTYFGGAGADYNNSVQTDALGNVYIAGETSSTASVSTAGVHQSVHGGNTYDAFLTKFDGNGSLLWSTYYGGTGNDYCYFVNTDTQNNIYISGETNTGASGIIATAGAHQPNLAGAYDGYIVKFNAAGIRQWGTYYGGAGNEHMNACSADVSGNVYGTGSTDAAAAIGVIATAGAHQTAFGGGNDDAFIVKFDAAGQRQWGTYCGGTGDDYTYFSSNDASGNVYVSGETTTSGGTGIASPGNYNYGGGIADAFLIKFASNGQRVFGTYYGGTAYDGSNFCSLDSQNNIYIGCFTSSGGSVASPGSHQPVYAGGYDAFIVKLRECANNLSPQVSSNSPVCLGGTVNLVGTHGPLVSSFIWKGPLSYTSGILSPTITNFNFNQTGTYSLTVYDAGGCYQTATLNVIISQPFVSVNSGTICIGNSFSITPSGAATYSIEGGNSIVNPTITTSYTVTGYSTNGCLSSNTATCLVTVDLCTGVNQKLFEGDINALAYPNPGKGTFEIRMKGTEIRRFRVYKGDGKLIQDFYDTNENVKLDLNHVSSGLYILKITSDKNVQNIRLSKE